MRYEMADPKALEPSAHNPRKISAGEMEKLRRSIREFGIVQPIIVQAPGNRIIAGHQRREAAIAEGVKLVPISRLRISDAKAQAMNLALNRISGEWDDEKLVALLRELQDADRLSTGFDEDEIAKLLGEPLEGRTVEEIEVKRAGIRLVFAFDSFEAPFQCNLGQAPNPIRVELGTEL
ncbi:MAG: ParB N-terminal domain-containing protein [Acidobacteriia bacterium]|nr:ParB N-terminal domain-containing protein [Terriglobia bacterium]